MTSLQNKMAATMMSLLITMVLVTSVIPCHVERDDQSDGQIVKCSDGDMANFEELSKIKRISIIDLRNNRMTSLKNISIPDNVQWIDLRGNQLSTLNLTDLELLFTTPERRRRILLSNNPFICDCEFIVAVSKFDEQVEDFQNITCLDSNNKLQVITDEICSKASYSSAFIITAGVVFVVKITLLAFWYRNYMKRFFYKHGCCKCCCRGEENDNVVWLSVEPNKSYSQQDLVENDTKEES